MLAMLHNAVSGLYSFSLTCFLPACCSLMDPQPTTLLLQIFKWELRKGWDVLLAAYLGQFTAADNVALYMKTSPYHSDSNFGDHMRKWAAEHLPASDGLDLDSLPTVYVIDENMAQDRLRRLYTSADCFVLPSR